MLTPNQVRDQAEYLHSLHETERTELDLIRRYWVGRQKLPALIPAGEPAEVRVMAQASRVNVMPIIVNSLVQSMFVDGFRAMHDDGWPADEDLDVWRAWQANRMDARQTGIHRVTAAYGTGYVIVLPGKELPEIRGVSPRALLALYGEDPDWPMAALERLDGTTWRVYDEEAIYYLERRPASNGQPGTTWTFLSAEQHGRGVTPIVRYVDEYDLDADDEVEAEYGTASRAILPLTRGQIGPRTPLQDQIDLTTFDLQIAQHYAAFKQRYIIGWAAPNEAEAIRVSAQRLVTIDKADDEDDFDPAQVKVGEWEQSSLEGYLKSRDTTLNHIASLAQLPLHELSGDAKLVNLSAEALAAAEASKDRKVGERKTLNGESHEQVLALVGEYMGKRIPDDAQVVWRDTSARSFAATVDALGKLATMLGVPAQELWERIPGVTRQDVDRFKAAAESGDAFGQLAQLLDRQGGDVPPAA